MDIKTTSTVAFNEPPMGTSGQCNKVSVFQHRIAWRTLSGRFSMHLKTVMGRRLLSLVTLGLVFTTGACSSLVDETQMEAFFTSLGNTSMTVYPTYIKRMATDDSGKPLGYDSEDSDYDSIETERLTAFLRCESLAKLTVSKEEVPLNSKWQRSQYGIYKTSSRSLSDYVAAHPINTEYAMMAEYVIPYDKVWAVHAYVVNARGDLVWILHLNEHFDVFTNINPQRPHGATDVLLNFLRTGWPSVQHITGTADTDSKKVQAGVFDDFETELLSGTDDHGIPLGFSTFSGPGSTVSISRTNVHPPRPGETKGNNVIQIDMNVKDWAGFLHSFENAAVDTWSPLDWGAFNGFSFWLYGNNSGVSLFVDILDNRKGCATYDDAERYTYEFVDDFSGWKQVSVQFSDMVRKEIGNRGPNDDLGLSEVHGWGFGIAVNRDSQATYYIDDFELWTTPWEISGDNIPVSPF